MESSFLCLSLSDQALKLPFISALQLFGLPVIDRNAKSLTLQTVHIWIRCVFVRPLPDFSDIITAAIAQDRRGNGSGTRLALVTTNTKDAVIVFIGLMEKRRDAICHSSGKSSLHLSLYIPERNVEIPKAV